MYKSFTKGINICATEYLNVCKFFLIALMPLIHNINRTRFFMVSSCFIFLYSPTVKGQDSAFSVKEIFKNRLAVPNINLPKNYFKDSSYKNLLLKHPTVSIPKFSKPLLFIGHGMVEYSSYYRANIDTPFFQNNVYQHQIHASVNLVMGNVLPFQFNTLLRRTNSYYFRDVNDFQLVFDAHGFQQKIYSDVLKNIAHIAEQYRDSLSGMLAQLKSLEYLKLNTRLNNIFTVQKLVEANELLNVPELSWDKNLPDSTAKAKSDSLINKASAFIKLYNESKAIVDSVREIADSIKTVYEKSVAKVKMIRDLSEGRITNYDQFKDIYNNSDLKNKGMELLPPKYRWLLGLRKFIAGRSTLNYSELTAKNTSLNGINLEYNSWYYVALSAGLIDFRFRDFAISKPGKYKQYFFMGRLGIGRLEKNFLIVSLFNGTKQVYTLNSINNAHSYNITGLSVEAKYQFSRNGYVKMEVAESTGPDFHTVPLKNNTWSLKNKNDKAYSIVAQFIIPKLQTKLEGYYKYTGANYQSFSTYQTNQSLNFYNVKLAQSLFKRQLRIIASVSTNEYYNPYLSQQYSNNTVFKSLQVVFRKRNWPVLSAAYMPLSQLTNLGGIVYENKYNSLNATIYHTYKVADINLVSTLMIAQFYNKQTDTGFIYFNAKNIVFNQLFNYRTFSTAMNISYSINQNFEYYVMDENVQIPIAKAKAGRLLFGVKIYHLNNLGSKLGCYTSYRIPVNRKLSFSLTYDNGYIPGINGVLVKNTIGNIQFSKSF